MIDIDALIALARQSARMLNGTLDELLKAGVETRVVPLDFGGEHPFTPLPTARVQLQILDVKHEVKDGLD